MNYFPFKSTFPPPFEWLCSSSWPTSSEWDMFQSHAKVINPIGFHERRGEMLHWQSRVISSDIDLPREPMRRSSWAPWSRPSRRWETSWSAKPRRRPEEVWSSEEERFHRYTVSSQNFFLCKNIKPVDQSETYLMLRWSWELVGLLLSQPDETPPGLVDDVSQGLGKLY